MKQPQRIRVDRSSRQTTREHKSSDVQVETEDGEYENLSSGLVSAAASSAHSPQDPERQHVPVHEATKSVAKNVSQTASDLPASSACAFKIKRPSAFKIKALSLIQELIQKLSKE